MIVGLLSCARTISRGPERANVFFSCADVHIGMFLFWASFFSCARARSRRGLELAMFLFRAQESHWSPTQAPLTQIVAAAGGASCARRCFFCALFFHCARTNWWRGQKERCFLFVRRMAHRDVSFPGPCFFPARAHEI